MNGYTHLYLTCDNEELMRLADSFEYEIEHSDYGCRREMLKGKLEAVTELLAAREDQDLG